MAERRPKIEYPCMWEYAVIGMPGEELLVAIQGVVQARSHQVKFSKKSAEGKYWSYHLKVRVESEADRNEIFQKLRAHPLVKMVL